MTREETIRLLQFLKGCYPNVKIDDPSGMVDGWMLAFSDKDAKEVYKGARLHISNNRFFPTPADINQCIKRAVLLYDDLPAPALQSGINTESLPSQTDDDIEAIIKCIFGDITN